jgi:hypothetical protein
MKSTTQIGLALSPSCWMLESRRAADHDPKHRPAQHDWCRRLQVPGLPTVRQSRQAWDLQPSDTPITIKPILRPIKIEEPRLATNAAVRSHRAPGALK